MAKLTLNTIGSRYGSIDALNDNFNAIEAAIENTFSLDGTSPNTLAADLDMNNQDILNAKDVNASNLYINGVLVEPSIGVSASAVFQTYEFTATAGQTTFSVFPATPQVASLYVSINGLVLPPSEISVSTTNVVIPACTVGDEVMIRRYTTSSSAAPDASNINFIQAGTGAATSNVQTKLRESVSIEDFGAAGTSISDSAALRAAVTYAETRNIPVVLPARRIYYDGVAITNDKVRLWGQGMPTVNASRTALAGGTVIEGPLILTGKYIELRDFGVDLGTTGSGADVDGIKCTAATYNSGVHLHTENLIALCKNKTSAAHALLFEGFQKHTGGNLYGVHGFFGCVIKNRGVQLTSVETWTNADTGLYLKSDNIYGTCSDVQIATVRVRVADTMGIRIQSDSATMENVQLGAVYVSDSDRAVCVQVLDAAGVKLNNVHIDSVISWRAVTADLSILSLRSGASADNVEVDDLVAINGTGKALETSCQPGATIKNLGVKSIFASYPAGASQVTMDSAVFIAGGVLSTDFRSVEVVENFGAGSKFGAINYQNTSDPKTNLLGSHRCKVIGSGRPLPGNLNQTLSGATATLQIPENLSGDHVSFCRVTIAANTTITTFTPEWATQVFNLGHLLFIYNNSAFTLSVGHNVGQGIINQASATINLAGSEVAAWVHIGGGVWSQLKIA